MSSTTQQTMKKQCVQVAHFLEKFAKKGMPGYVAPTEMNKKRKKKAGGAAKKTTKKCTGKKCGGKKKSSKKK